MIRPAASPCPWRLIVGGLGLLIAFQAFGQSFEFNDPEDFNEGDFDGVQPGEDGIDFVGGSTFPVLWVANAGEDTVSRIDTEDDCETARYETWFDSGTHGAFSGPAPSRTAVDNEGNVYVANRHFDGAPPSVLKILAEGGIDRNNSGTLDTSADANGDCTIQPDELITLVDTNEDGVLNDAELADERVAWITILPAGDVDIDGDQTNEDERGALGRSLCIDGEGDVWIGTFNSRHYYQLEPDTGAIVSGPHDTLGRNYGCVIDSDGMLYSSTLSNQIHQIDTNAPENETRKTSFNARSTYGIAAGTDLVYTMSNGLNRLDTTTDNVTNPTISVGGLGISVGADGHVYTGNTTVGRFIDNGTDTLSPVWTSDNPSGSSATRGVVIDSDGNIWVVNLNANNVTKFDGETGELLTTLPVGASPYTYSDATGFAARNVTDPVGFWRNVLDTEAPDFCWELLDWNQAGDGTITAEFRASNTEDGLSAAQYAEIPRGERNRDCWGVGRFGDVRVALRPGEDREDPPVITELTVTGPEEADQELTRVSFEPAGENCEQGGFRVDLGVDTNGDGILQDEEITTTRYDCNEEGEDDILTVLTRVAEEPAGDNCANGGQRIETGLDDNGDGTLQDEEVTDTQFVCNEPDAQVLTRTREEPAGNNCPEGGQRIESGLDENNNGSLEDEEVDSTEFVCNEPTTDGDDGNGGGSMGLWTLLALILGLATRARRAATVARNSI